MRTGQRGARRGITALALSAGLVATGSAVTHAEPSEPVKAGERDQSVTLITGDRVELDGGKVVQYVPGPGRQRVLVRTYTENGHQYVVPVDAQPLIESGKLDRRLFDITSLVEFGYDDARRDTVPVIVRSAAGARSGGVSALSAQKELPALGAVTGTAAKSGSAWESLRGGAVEKVWLDGIRTATLDQSTKQIGAPKAWEAGFTGKGVKVAVLDTGVDEKHPDLTGKQVAEKNFTEEPDATDGHGHGTHVASTIASKGEKYRGVAPDAQIIDGKVLNSGGGGSESGILAGMQWAADQGAHVINMSLGGGDGPEIDVLEEAVNRISKDTGTLFVIAAGNSGPGAESIGSPGSAEAALTVGAVDRNDNIAPFSSRGPAADGGVKPDVTAPGVDIVAAKAGTQDHRAMSGTSMATPHVAGVVALLKQQHPDWTGARLKSLVMASAKANPALKPFDQGNGRVDVPKALEQKVIAEPGGLNFGVQLWPHDDDQKVTREITYRNTGTEPVTLDLTVDVTGPGGAAPAGMFTLSPQKLTVPAGGEAKASVTVDTKVNAPDGSYHGAVVTQTGLRTPISVHREVESYEVNVTALGLDGKPSTTSSTVIIDNKTGKRFSAYSETGQKTVRLPKGDYMLISSFDLPEQKLAIVVQPTLAVTGKAEVATDARTAKPVVLKTPDPTAEGIASTLSFVRPINGRPFSDGWLLFGGLTGDISIAHKGPERAGFTTTFASQLKGTARDEKTPVSYRLLYTEHKRVPTGYDRTAKPSELAEMSTGFRAEGTGRKHMVAASPRPKDGSGAFSWYTPIPENGRGIDLVTTADAKWSWLYLRTTEAGELDLRLATPSQNLKAGKKYTQKLNTPISGPAVPEDPDFGLARFRDQIAVVVPLFADKHGGAGDAATTSARTALFRDGKKIGEKPEPGSVFDVPSDEGTYRAEMEQTRDSVLSTKVSGAWTFKSKQSTDITKTALSVVRFQPKLDDDGTAHGRALLVPLKIDQQAGTPKVRKVTVEVSFDDGKTWRQVPVAANNAVVQHEKGAKFASLRAKTTDAAGNTGEVTIIRAYQIAG